MSTCQTGPSQSQKSAVSARHLPLRSQRSSLCMTQSQARKCNEGPSIICEGLTRAEALKCLGIISSDPSADEIRKAYKQAVSHLRGKRADTPRAQAFGHSKILHDASKEAKSILRFEALALA
eukprot:5472623-Amphidinium_carterae.3